MTPRLPARTLAARLAAVEQGRHVATWTFRCDDGTTINVPMLDALSVISLARDLGDQPPPPLLLRMARVTGDLEGCVMAGALGQLARYALTRTHDQETASC